MEYEKPSLREEGEKKQLHSWLFPVLLCELFFSMQIILAVTQAFREPALKSNNASSKWHWTVLLTNPADSGCSTVVVLPLLPLEGFVGFWYD